jgi:hypothetical protein
MKIKDIVEHKKGHRAKLYTKKPQQQTTKPGMPQVDVNEDGEAYKVTQNDPNTGLTLAKPDGTQLILPPEKVASVMADPTDPNKFTLNPDAVADANQDPTKPVGPAIGANVELAAAEDIGGDPTDDFIKDVSVKPHVQGSYNYEAHDDSFSMTPEEFMTGLAQTARENDTDLSPADMESAKKFIVPDGQGNVNLILTMQKMSKAFDNPEFLKMIDDLKTLVGDTTDVPMSQQPSDRPASIKPVTPSADTASRQADDELLEKMRTIAGLR